MKNMVHQLTEMTGFTEMTSEITGTTLKSTGMMLQIHKNRDTLHYTFMSFK